MDNESVKATESPEAVLDELMRATRDFLSTVLKKSGLRGDINKLATMVTFVVNDNKMRSFLLGEFVQPTEQRPTGEIRLHLDAMIDYSTYLGVDYWSLVAKVLLSQIHHALTYESGKRASFLKAEQFASKACRKLMRQGIIDDLRPQMYTADPVTLLARRKWIEKWLGMGLDEAMSSQCKAFIVSPDQPTESEGNTGT